MTITLDFGGHLTLDPATRVCVRGASSLTDEQLREVAARNDGWRIEREPDGTLTLRPELGTVSGLQVAALNDQIERWAVGSGRGVALGPSCAMRLPSGALRCPCAAFVAADRWDALSPATRDGFLPWCADFVAEVVTPFCDRAERTQRMLEYKEQGARLGWLIDPACRTVDVFRPRRPIMTHENLTHLTERPDEAVLPGFVLDLRRVWNAGRAAADA